MRNIEKGVNHILPNSAASELGLHCLRLPMSLLQDARHKWVEKFCFTT